MTHRDYFLLDDGDPKLKRLATELARYARDVIVEWVLERNPGTLDEWHQAELDALLDTRTASHRDAPPAQGRFPLVIYHSGYGSSYEDNAVLCEYLASHGYVVVGSAFLAEDGKSFNIDGKAGSGRDTAFLIDAHSDAPDVDWTRIGDAGRSGGTHATLLYQPQPMAAVDAVISLDTTQDYVSALDPHWGHPRPMLEAIDTQTAPILAVAKPHAFFQVCDALENAERYYLTFRDLDHNDYTLQGVMTAEVLSRRAAKEGADDAEERRHQAARVREGFDQCTAYIRLFLDAQLKGDSGAIEKLASEYRSTPLDGPDPHVQYAPIGSVGPEPYSADRSVPPTPRELVAWIADEGAGPALAALSRFHSDAPEASVYHSQFAYGVLYDLVARGRSEDAEILAPFYREHHDNLVRLLLWWADRGDGDRYRDFKRHALATARLIEPDNADVLERIRTLEESSETMDGE